MNQWHCCRTCLGETSLSPIFQILNCSNKYTDILLKATGTKMEFNDALPQFICTNCINFINSYLKFRETCHRSYKTLMKRLKNNEKCHKLKNSPFKTEFNRPLTSIDISKVTEKSDTDSDFDDANNDEVDDFNNVNEDTFDNKNIFNGNINNSNNMIEFEAEIQDILNRPVEIIFRNEKLNRIVKLNKFENKSNGNINKIENNGLNVQKIEKEVDEGGICEYCNKMFKTNVSLKNHYKIHTGQNIICEHCGKKFMNKRRLLMHCKAKHGYEKTDKCSYCEYRGCNAELVKIHERLHTGERPYICSHCGTGFHRKSSYLQHVPIHLPDKNVQCDECPARFKSVTLMRIHKSRHKPRRHAFACGECRARFATRRDCTRHVSRSHADASVMRVTIEE